MIKLLLFTGARRGEALQAKWCEFDLDRGLWTVPVEHLKGGKRNRFDLKRSLSTATIDFMKAWKQRSQSPTGFEPTSYVFPNTKDLSRPRHCIKAIWQRVRTKSGVPEMHLHDLRHFYASKALDEGANIFEIGASLGHRSTETTKVYARAAKAGIAKVPSLVSNAIERAVSNG